jgi:YD repeat-containing protein
MYGIFRNNTLIDWVINPEYEDNSVSASTSYTYYIIACDFAINCTAGTAFNVTTPPAGSIDPRRVGITALAPMWGGTGENIDVRSGNLNYTIPLVKPVGLGGLSVPINLSYNSQFWRQESGTTWRLLNPTGNGVGWMVQAGSLTPVYTWAWSAPTYYLFVDTTGAEYRLDQVSNGVYSSTQSIYVWFDSNTKRLWFKDGTFWLFGCISAGYQGDAGTMYPTLIEDQLGNYIAIRYDQGSGASWPNSSGRISEIEDSRSTTNGPSGLPATYVFTNTNQALYAISNTVGSNENYTFTRQSMNLVSPFDGTFSVLSGEIATLYQSGTGETTSFTYDSSGELTQVNLPHGGHLRWTYTTMDYTGNCNLREVQNRYLQIAAGTGTEYTYDLAHSPSDSGYSFHSLTTLSDVTGNATKQWNFQLTTGVAYGLTSQFQEQTTGATVWPNVVQYSYAQNASGNTYANSVTSYRNFGQPDQVQKTINQTADRYGNPTTVVEYDYWTTTLLNSRTITNTWLEGPDGNPWPADALYFRNRLVTSTKTDGTNAVTTVSNGWGAWPTSVYQLLGGSTTPTTTTSYTYDKYGNVTGQTMNGLSTSITMDPTHNYAVPSSITTGTSSATLQWSSFLGLTQNEGQNGDYSQISYNGSGFPTTTVSPYGATTTNSYSIYNSSTGTPTTVLSVTNNHFSRQTLDGVGHVVLRETGTVSGSTYTTVSQVSSVYAPCGCSPMGKLQKVSQPYAPGGTPVFTVYAYDGLGRTTSVTLPDGSVTQYVYDNRATTDPIASFVDITDPAGKKKRYQMDGYGHLTQVIEDPAGLAYATIYTYL